MDNNSYASYLEAFAQKHFSDESVSGTKLTDDQQKALSGIEPWLKNRSKRRCIVLTGAAGTGKTTLASELIRSAEKAGLKVQLLAPTGRAAKVIAGKTNRQSSTIHRHIYSVKEKIDKKSGALSGIQFSLKTGKRPDVTLYIVDEASMLAGQKKSEGLFLQNALLDDFIQYVYSGNEQNIILFTGDPYQLPPVGETLSPALDPARLVNEYNLDVASFELTEVKRQSQRSLILDNAIQLRDAIRYQAGQSAELQFDQESVVRIRGYKSAVSRFVEDLKQDPDQTLFLTLSNQWAAKINQETRRLLFGKEDLPPQKGEILLNVKNHYYEEAFEMKYIANGENVVYLDKPTDEIEQIAGLTFSNARFSLEIELGNSIELQRKYFIDLLHSKDPALPAESLGALFQSRRKTVGKNLQSWTDPYLNALQLKYGYAVTCHKAQGGEWKNVYILQEFSRFADQEKLRWLYTALTRASKKIYYVTI